MIGILAILNGKSFHLAKNNLRASPWYISDIPCDSRIWLNKPDVGIHQKNGFLRRNPTIEKVICSADPFSIDKLVNELDSYTHDR